MLNIVWRRDEIEIQGRMERRPARVKASTRLSVKPLDAASGMMDRSTDNVNNFDLIFLHSAGQQWETEHVYLEAKPTHLHPPLQLVHPPLQLVQQVRKRKSYIQASFRVCRNPKRNTIFPLFTTVFTLHRQSSVSGKRNTSPNQIQT